MLDNLTPNSTKQIILKEKKIIEPKEKKQRVVIKEKSWVFDANHYQPENQTMILYDNSETTPKPYFKKLVQQIRNKIASYKTQDMEKAIYDPTKLISLEQTIEKLKHSSLKCFYCKTQVLLIYEFVREPKQWTLERLDNGEGHTDTNTVIACLSCNLRRRTMHFDRYIETKQMANIVKVGEPTVPPTTPSLF
jgi:hypothetical protein